MQFFLKCFSSVFKAWSDLSEQMNRLVVRAFSGQLYFYYWAANEMIAIGIQNFLSTKFPVNNLSRNEREVKIIICG